jgi:hypothetical protein
VATRIPNAGQEAALNAVADRADGGPAAGTLEFRTGAQPADADDAATGTLLCTFTLNDPAFAAASGGSKALDVAPALSTVGVAAGDAGWFRILDSTGVKVLDGDITATGGGGDIEVDNVSIAIDQVVNLTGLNVTIPASE